MALSTSTVIAQIRDLVATVSGINRVYAVSETDENAIPPALNELPCAMVFYDTLIAYLLSAGQHRHTYQVRVDIFVSGGDIGARVVAALPMVDRTLELFALNVTLGNRCNSCRVMSAVFTGFEYPPGGPTYTGYRIIVEISEQASAAPATGS